MTSENPSSSFLQVQSREVIKVKRGNGSNDFDKLQCVEFVSGLNIFISFFVLIQFLRLTVGSALKKIVFIIEEKKNSNFVIL